MSTHGEEPQEQPASRPGSYGEIAPGVPRYGQYAPVGWEPPQDVIDAQKGTSQPGSITPSSAYPGFAGIQPGAREESGAPTEAPKRVLLATKFIMAAGILQLIALLIWAFALSTPGGQEVLRSAVGQAMATNPEAAATVSAQQLFITVAIFMGIIQLTCAAGYFWIAAKLRRGRNWARTTALVFAIVSIVLVPEGGSYAFYSGARIILGLVAVFMLFRSPAKEFFLAHKAKRNALKR